MSRQKRKSLFYIQLINVKRFRMDFNCQIVNDDNLFELIVVVSFPGHSRTIVGYEQFPNGNIRLIIFDPSTSKNQIENFIQNSTNGSAHIFRRSLASFQKPVYQILAVQRVLQENDREVKGIFSFCFWFFSSIFS